MVSTLENNFLTVTVNHRGAELSSIKSKDGVEYLWQADNKYWGRHAPVLFPIVGKLKDRECRIDETMYYIEQHGFARDMSFQLLDEKPGFLKFQYHYNLASLELYPYKFTLNIIYQLVQNQLQVIYEVENGDTKEMFFSIGAHPGFNVPLLPQEKFEDYYLEFEKNEKLERYHIDQGLLTDIKEVVPADGSKIPLTHPLFNKDALVFKGLQSESVTIKTSKSPRSIKVDIKGFPYLGIWSKDDAPFVCIEPWYGVADHVASNKNFKAKEGIQILNPSEKFTCKFGITIN